MSTAGPSTPCVPVFRPHIDAATIEAVADTLRSGWLATGPRTAEFETAFAAYVGAPHAIATNAGTTALELALHVAGIGAGDEVITTPLTFVATANAIARLGAVPVFADVTPNAWTLCPDAVRRAVTPRTRAILPVHFAGRACAMAALREVARAAGAVLIADAAHAIETRLDGTPVGGLADVSAFSFHPAKNVAACDGGMLVTHRTDWAERARRVRYHGIARPPRSATHLRAPADVDVLEAGWRCAMNDVQATLALHQLAQVEARWSRRRAIVARYDDAFAGLPGVSRPAPVAPRDRHAWHLYNLVLDPTRGCCTREVFRERLAARGIGTAVHYPALHESSHYGQPHAARGEAPTASRIARGIVTLPLFPELRDAEIEAVADAVRDGVAP